MDQEPKLLPEAVLTFQRGHALYLEIMAIRAAKAANNDTSDDRDERKEAA